MKSRSIAPCSLIVDFAPREQTPEESAEEIRALVKNICNNVLPASRGHEAEVLDFCANIAGRFSEQFVGTMVYEFSLDMHEDPEVVQLLADNLPRNLLSVR